MGKPNTTGPEKYFDFDCRKPVLDILLSINFAEYSTMIM
jgi:hypothetical protein